MTREQAIGVAQREAEKQGWPRLEPVEARRSRRWLIGATVWEVASNAQSKGMNVRVRIEDDTGRICRAGYTQR
jgi:hypothetical protein